MVRRLILLFLLLSLAGGVLGGTPLHMSSSKMMKCCDKAKSKNQTPAANAANLCCAVNCSEPTPAPSGAAFNFSPGSVNVTESVAKQLAELFGGRKQFAPLLVSTEPNRVFQSSQPKFIQHHAFLI